MGRIKHKHLHRILLPEGIIIVYKISNGIEPVKVVQTKIAFNDQGDYTNKVKSLMTKLNLENDASGGWTTAETFDEFCTRLYLHHDIHDNTFLPPNAHEVCKRSYLYCLRE